MKEQCTICGSLQTFSFVGGDARDDAPCGVCSATLKERDAAHHILSHLSSGPYTSIKEYLDANPAGQTDIVEFAFSSALSRYLSVHPGYSQVYYWLSGQSQKNSRGRVLPFCDLHATGFAPASKDIVVTNDALGFVEDLPRVVAEMGRVLRRQGVFLSIAQIDWPIPDATKELIESERKSYRVPDGVMPKRRHLGADLRHLFAENGFRLMLRQIGISASGKRNFSLVGIRL